MIDLQVRGIYKSFGNVRALSDISFEVLQGEILCILGPSGCGKSTLLSLIAGFDLPDQGDIVWNGESLTQIPSHKRGFGLMFQDYALFPHLNVFQNIAFGLKMAGESNDEISYRINLLLALVGLSGYEKRNVQSLSGGEQQRVALVRSLAPQPRLLMLDEPLGALDKALREHLLIEMREVLAQLNQTTIYVTHDQEEAFSLADRVLVMQTGKTIQIGSPREIYRHPTSVFLAQFLGLSNFLPGSVVSENGQVYVVTMFGKWRLDKNIAPNDGEGIVLIRSDSVFLNQMGECFLRGFIKEKIFRGIRQRVEIEAMNPNAERQRLKFDFSSHDILPEIGDEIVLSFDPLKAIQFFQF